MCKEALGQLKKYLTTPPLLSKLVDRERLFIYLGVSERAISAVPVREEDETQLPVILDAETPYTQMDKLVLALVTTVQKLHSYFQGNPIIVYTTYPLMNILHTP